MIDPNDDSNDLTIVSTTNTGDVQSNLCCVYSSTTDCNDEECINNNNNNNTSTRGNAWSVVLNEDVPLLQSQPPRKVCLMVEPTPFTYVSGYANRFKEMLKFLKYAGDNVTILTTDSRTMQHELPNQFVGYPIQHTAGFTCPFYDPMGLTLDLPQMKGVRILKQFRPDLIHVTSPGFMVFAALFYARVLRIPLLISYHTHLPTYGTLICAIIIGIPQY